MWGMSKWKKTHCELVANGANLPRLAPREPSCHFLQDSTRSISRKAVWRGASPEGCMMAIPSTQSWMCRTYTTSVTRNLLRSSKCFSTCPGLRLGCGIQCTEPMNPLEPKQRPKLFAAAMRLLRFAIFFCSYAALIMTIVAVVLKDIHS